MFSERARTHQAISLVVDAACICLAFGAALALRLVQDAIPGLRHLSSYEWTPALVGRSEYAIILVAFVFVWTVYLRRSRLYVDGDAGRASLFVPIYLKGLLVGVLSSGAVLFGLKVAVSRLLFGYFFVFACVLLMGKQLLSATLHRRLADADNHRRHALVIGSGRSGAWFSAVVAGASRHGYALVGLLLPDEAVYADTGEVPVVGTVSDLNRVLQDHPVEEVFIVGSGPELARLAPVAETLIQRGRVVSIVSTPSTSDQGVRGRVTDFTGVPVISYGPMPKDEVRSGTKRALDVALSGAALIALSPILPVVAALIKIIDPGPIFFRQERLGRNGKRFTLYKFRSMKADAEQILKANPDLHERYVQNDYKLPEDEDPRISRLGRFLRKSSLDELPQLWNVLRGEMTLVGPRPIVPDELKNYRPYEDLFLSVKPGLTGRWQADGRCDVRYPERAFMDIDYIGEQSVLADLEIMARTVPGVIRGRGAR